MSIAPIIIADNSPEKEKLIPSGRNDENGKTLIPEQIKIATMHIIIRLALLLKNLHPNVTKNPKPVPTTKLANIDKTGQTTSDIKSGVVPLAIAFDIENNISKAIKATASSKATTGRSVLTTGPFALYCFTTSNVAAGAVAQAIAPKVNMISSGISLINILAINNPAITKIAPPRASKIVMTTILLPIAFNEEARNDVPIEKAINPNAALLTKSITSSL